MAAAAEAPDVRRPNITFTSSISIFIRELFGSKYQVFVGNFPKFRLSELAKNRREEKRRV